MPVTNKPKWTQLMSDCLSDFVREQAGSSYPVVDYELRVGPDKAPDDMVVWFICRTQRVEAMRFFTRGLNQGGSRYFLSLWAGAKRGSELARDPTPRAHSLLMRPHRVSNDFDQCG